MKMNPVVAVPCLFRQKQFYKILREEWQSLFVHLQGLLVYKIIKTNIDFSSIEIIYWKIVRQYIFKCIIF